jgi:CDP-glucose 4,6-dehydratase
MTSLSSVYRAKKILVTGHTGFKGSWLCEWLLGLGAEVAGFSIDVPTEPSHFEKLGLKSRMRHELGDIRDAARLQSAFKAFQPEIVFHLAAQALVRPSYDDPAGTFATNVMGTVNVFEAVRKTPSVRAVVNVTSDKCYENFERSEGYRETDPMGGKDPYSASKGAAELVFGSYRRTFFAETGAPAVGSVRAGNVIGGGDYAVDRIVPDCVRAWSKNEKVLIRNPGSIRPWQHVLEPLGGYLVFGARLSRGELAGEAFNFGPSKDANRTVKQLLEEMQKSWPEAAWEQDPAGSGKKKEAGILMLDCTKAAKDLHWRPTLSFAESVAWTSRWYQGQAKSAEQIREYERLAAERGAEWAKSSN